MKPEVYEAMREAFENGCDGVGGFRKKYEEIKSDYDDLEIVMNIQENIVHFAMK